MGKHTHSQLDAPNMTFKEEFDDKSESVEVSIQMTYWRWYNHTFISKFGRDIVLDKWGFFININR